MAVTTNWSIDQMQRDDSTGGVTIVYWSLVAKNDSGNESATEGGKLRLEYDADADDFVAYNNLTEDTVLGWVYDSLREGDETADEAKARIETDRTDKVDAQIAKNANTSTGKPW